MFGAASGGAGAGAVVRQGHLRKLKTMKKKYFVLRAEASDGARLEYYESEKKFRSGAAPRRVLPLKSCYDITRRLDLKQKHVIALFTREEQFCVVAENEKELHDWLTAILKQHGSDDASEELLHPIQHVWQVNVQKKGLGASKNIQGLYNLCLTDKTLTLVKIKSHNNVIRELAIPERIEYSLKNIRRCGDSECFFYMEVGRQTSTGAGELWMHSDDSNIAQSMHSTIYLAMKNCTKDDERDHIPLPKNRSLEGSNPPRDRSQSMYSDSKKSRPGLANDNKGLCVGSCIRQCVCPAASYSVDDSAAALAPVPPGTPKNDAGPRSRCESMPSYPRASAPFETDKPPARLADLADGDLQRTVTTNDRMSRSRLRREKRHKEYMSSDSLLLLLDSMRNEAKGNLYTAVETKFDTANTLERRSNMRPIPKSELSRIMQEEMQKYMNKLHLKEKIELKSETQDVDEDMKFLMMIIPLLKKLNDEQRHFAKIEILNVMDRAKQFQGPLCQNACAYENCSSITNTICSMTHVPLVERAVCTNKEVLRPTDSAGEIASSSSSTNESSSRSTDLDEYCDIFQRNFSL